MRWLTLCCFLFGLAANGCQTDAFCFNCTSGGGGGQGGGTGTDDSGIIVIPPEKDTGAPPPMMDAGHPKPCSADLNTDPNNCGECGKVCSIPGAFPKCVDGKCEFDKCADGLVDVNEDLADGCECTVTNGGTEICDDIDNDCNGKKDDGFDLQTDVDNCGDCNTPCPELPHATRSCAKGKCQYECEAGYDNLGQPGDGCPYKCPVVPSIPEVCNGVDDDCDGIIDDGDPGAGVPCDDNCPEITDQATGMKVHKCLGECQPGTTVCTGTSEGVACVGGTRDNPDICDGKDNDCDGQTDEDYNLTNDKLNCGACGVQCLTGSNCVNGFCDFKCAADQRDLDGNPANGCEYTCPVFPLKTEVCNGVDENCDGIVDNGATDVGKACTGNCPAPDPCVATGNCGPYQISTANGSCYGVCSANGVTACPSGISVCTYSVQRVDEICNNLDDNCDGRIDEGFDKKSDPANCGACGTVCTKPNTLAISCLNGVCAAVTACAPGYRDNNGQVADGCEYKCPIYPPVGESCNGIDDNCDGLIDNAPAGSGQSCTADCPAPAPCIAAGNCTLQISGNESGCYGACAFDGRTSCAAGASQCTHPAKTAELCNGLDDDCDGLIDDGFDLLTDKNNCGACGFRCALPGASGVSCVAGTCRGTTCTPGFLDLDGDATNGCEYACPVFPIKTETCNNIDDDCDGVRDDSPTDAGKACTGSCPPPDPCVATGNCSPATIAPGTNGCYGVCRNGGLTVCMAGGSLQCSYQSLTTTETCNNVDDNCDGRVDEGFNKQTDANNCGACGNVCTAPNTASRTCAAGSCGAITSCTPGFKDLNGNPVDGCEYTCPVMPPVGEACNNKDDDCNGVKDDNVVGLGQACTSNCPTPNPCVAAGNCGTATSSQTNGCYGICATDGRTSCPSGSLVCNHVAFSATEACNGADDNCDGRIDEGFNFATDVTNCGGCGAVCALPGAVAKCVGGMCLVNNCTAGRADVDGNAANGCEYACPVLPTKAELCNGLDDDCDGTIDDSPTDVGTSCQTNCPGGVCHGICTPGTLTCISGSKVCQGGGGAKLEVCNNADDDCDNVVDNGFNKQTDPLNCGTCGTACNLPNTSVNNCVTGLCKVGACDPGFSNLDGNDANGCEHTCQIYPTRTETCNGVDDDCDGLVDSADPQLGTPANFCLQTGPCAGSVPVCNAKGGVTTWHCNYNADVDTTPTGAVAPSESRCDGKDNNCNGQPDEAFPLKGQDCSIGKGICAGNAKYACTTDQTGITCPTSATPGNAKDEDCNGLDDNCDGNVDERNPTIPAGGLLCFNGGQHTCLGWVEPMAKLDTNVWVYSYEASRPDATNTNAGSAVARACSKANRLPWNSLNYTEAAAACAAVKNSAGASMRLCTEPEWQKACSVNNAANLWSYSTAQGTYVADRCNDNSTASSTGPWPTGKTGAGADNTCYADWGGANRIYDMSGNLSEWTSTTATSNGSTYQRVRGGNYQTFPNGTKCDFAFVLQLPTFQNFDLGFRCCSDAAP